MLSPEEYLKIEQEENERKKAKKAKRAAKVEEAKRAGKVASSVDEATLAGECENETEVDEPSKKRKLSEDTTVAEFADRWLACCDCGVDFCFSASEQRFFSEKGFGTKSRCAECTQVKKSRFGESSGKGTAAKERAARTKCYTCGETGHASKQCPQAPCYNCGAIGHKSAACTQPRNNQAGGGICFKFQTGSCTRGETCRFAHILEQ